MSPSLKMTIPASSLIEKLLNCPDLMDLRQAEYPHKISERLTYNHAVAMAMRGEIEGVFSSNGRFKFLRLLPENQRQPAAEIEQSAHIFHTSKSGTKAPAGTITAQTNMGVYRQSLCIGWVWRFHHCSV